MCVCVYVCVWELDDNWDENLSTTMFRNVKQLLYAKGHLQKTCM